MLRRLLLYLSQAGWARALVTRFFLARRVARRFVAGESLDEAIAVAHDLNTQGLLVTLDYLGESVKHADDTQPVVAMYLELLDRIHAGSLDASVSLKLTHMGLDISEDLCMTNVRHILTRAQEKGDIPVTIDMESSDYTDVTLRFYRTLRDEYGFANVGTVIQSALRRSDDDMRDLAAEGARIRLVKGAYLEPEAVAYPDKANVDAAFKRQTTAYADHLDTAYLELGTHDEAMIAAALALDPPKERYEIQMLYGIRQSRQLELAAAGYQMRVYVPFGEAWYPYFMRRLAERPANLGFFLRSLFRG